MRTVFVDLFFSIKSPRNTHMEPLVHLIVDLFPEILLVTMSRQQKNGKKERKTDAVEQLDLSLN